MYLKTSAELLLIHPGVNEIRILSTKGKCKMKLSQQQLEPKKCHCLETCHRELNSPPPMPSLPPAGNRSAGQYTAQLGRPVESRKALEDDSEKTIWEAEALHGGEVEGLAGHTCSAGRGRTLIRKRFSRSQGARSGFICFNLSWQTSLSLRRRAN